MCVSFFFRSFFFFSSSFAFLFFSIFFISLSFSLSSYISHFARRRENQYFLATSASWLGRNREENSIGALFYKYLSSFESIGDCELSFPTVSPLSVLLYLLLSLSLTLSFSFLCVRAHPLSPRPNSRACICSCKSFIRFVHGFASITAVGNPNRLFHLGSASSIFLIPLFALSPPLFRSPFFHCSWWRVRNSRRRLRFCSGGSSHLSEKVRFSTLFLLVSFAWFVPLSACDMSYEKDKNKY